MVPAAARPQLVPACEQGCSHQVRQPLDRGEEHCHRRCVQALVVEARRLADARQEHQVARCQARQAAGRLSCIILTDATTARPPGRPQRKPSTGLNPADIKSQRKHSYFHLWKALGTYYYGINVKNITNVNQRRAMAFGINRTQIIKYIAQLGQQPARGFTPACIAGGPTILKHAYFPAVRSGREGQGLPQEGRAPEDRHPPVRQQLARPCSDPPAVQAQWEEIGLNVSIRVQEWNSTPVPRPAAEQRRGRLPAGLDLRLPGCPERLVLWTCGSGNNNTNSCNHKFDRSVAQGSRRRRHQALRALPAGRDSASSAKGDVPLIPIYSYVYSNLIRPSVHGYVINPMDQTDYSKVSMK